MKLLKSIRRYFIAYENEKAASDFLCNIFGWQIVALLQEGIDVDVVSNAVQCDKTLKGYFIGLAFHVYDKYKLDDFPYALNVVGDLLGHVLNHHMVSDKTDFVELLVQSYNIDRKEMVPEFERGLGLADADAKFYLVESKFQLKDRQLSENEIPAKAGLRGQAFSFFKVIKANHQSRFAQ